MKRKIFFAALTVIFISTAVYAASDAFTRRLKICNSYKTTYKNSQGKIMKKAVMGAIYKSVAQAPYCYYYEQQDVNNYRLCYISVNDLKGSKPNLSKASCVTADEELIEQTYKELGASTYLLQRAIIKSTN